MEVVGLPGQAALDLWGGGENTHEKEQNAPEGGEKTKNLSPGGFQGFKSLSLLWDLSLFCLSIDDHNGLTTGLLKILSDE